MDERRDFQILPELQTGKWVPPMIPFILTSVAYMTHFTDLQQSVHDTLRWDDGTYWSAFLKCCPVLCLITFVVSYEDSSLSTERFRYKVCIAIGLTLGCIGDACLVFSSTFVLGMIAFAGGHIFYIYAYGMKPLKPMLGVFLFSVCSVLLVFVREGVADPVIRHAMPFYSVLLVAMAWRGLALVNDNCWSKVRSAGGVLFLISDFLLILQFDLHIPYGEMLVLGTYFSSQMCTALSILDATVAN